MTVNPRSLFRRRLPIHWQQHGQQRGRHDCEEGWPCIVPVPIYSTGPSYYFDNPNSAQLRPGQVSDADRGFQRLCLRRHRTGGGPEEPFNMLDPNKDNRSDTADDILDAVEDVDLDSDPATKG